MDVWISVIKLNPGLQRAKFQNVNSHKDILDESRMLDALKGLRRLQHIHLPAAPSVAYLRRILDICPSLQELSVQILLASGQTEWPNDYRDKPAMMTTYSLRKLALVYCFHNPPVTELLSCFPVLEGLELGQVGIECRQGLIVVFKEGGLPLLSSITMREYDDYTELMDAIPVQQLRMNSGRPWVCMDLEKLVVTIGVSHMFSSLLPPVLADAIAENRDGPTRMSNCQLAEKLFAERFRNLKKLRDVRITTRNRAGRLSYGDCDSESELDTDELGFPTYDMTPAGVMRWRFH
ncbi:hypothetical protein BGZ73_008407 [Actinomortierella ambigua]|nr:hypothetical protein BGZ73_008407 [Actinomortierella ambigua]